MVQDRRVRKSQQAIQSAFLELLKGESFEKLTVQQLADKADINRGTFYSYYLDKYDLLEQMENQIIDDLQKFISDQHHREKKGIPTDVVKNIMVYLIEHIEENRKSYYMLFSIGKASMIQEKLYMLIYNHLSLYKSTDDTIETMPFSYFMSYVSGAGISLIKHWVQDSTPISKEDLIDHFYNLMNNGTASMIKK
ncbi:TetR/AcrR family transcriptional regulator [Staphylococcus nepalensis]